MQQAYMCNVLHSAIIHYSGTKKVGLWQDSLHERVCVYMCDIIYDIHMILVH